MTTFDIRITEAQRELILTALMNGRPRHYGADASDIDQIEAIIKALDYLDLNHINLINLLDKE